MRNSDFSTSFCLEKRQNSGGGRTRSQWFSYRKLDRTRPIIGDRRPPSPLDRIQPDGWLADYTTDLIDLLHVLGWLVLVEPNQADPLDRICAGPLLTVDTLMAASALDAPKRTGKSKTKVGKAQVDLF